VPKKVEGVKGLLDNLSEALVILDPALEVVEWNPAMERLTGVKSAAAIGRSAAALLSLFRDTTLVPLIRRALAGETPDAVELPHTSAGDDRVVWLKARCVPWRDGEGAVTGAVALFSDVSDQQRHALLLLAMEAIGQSLTSSLDLNEVLDTIVNKALEVMGAESAMVVLGDANAAEFRVMRAVGRLSGHSSSSPSRPPSRSATPRSTRPSTPRPPASASLRPSTGASRARSSSTRSCGPSPTRPPS